MSPPIRVVRKTIDPRRQWLLTDDGSQTLWDCILKETFHSGCGAVSESLYVYLLNSRVAERLLAGQASQIVEYGFGTGSSFLLTAALADAAKVDIRYIALECDLLPREIVSELQLQTPLKRLLSRTDSPLEFPDRIYSSLERVQSTLLKSWSRLSSDGTAFVRHRLELTNYVTLDLILGDASLFPQVRWQGEYLGRMNAVYFDPFAPEKDPGLWNTQVFRAAYRLLVPEGTLTSYCVKSSVRQLLQSSGFNIEKLPGPPGGKREVLRAIKPHPTNVLSKSLSTGMTEKDDWREAPTKTDF